MSENVAAGCTVLLLMSKWQLCYEREGSKWLRSQGDLYDSPFVVKNANQHWFNMLRYWRACHILNIQYSKSWGYRCNFKRNLKCTQTFKDELNLTFRKLLNARIQLFNFSVLFAQLTDLTKKITDVWSMNQAIPFQRPLQCPSSFLWLLFLCIFTSSWNLNTTHFYCVIYMCTIPKKYGNLWNYIAFCPNWS